jgi:putative redox protein
MNAMQNSEDAVLVEETGAGRFQVRVTTGDTIFFADEPSDVGGLGSGPNPFDLLCAALGSCTLMTMRLYSERKDWAISRMSVRVRHSKPTPQSRDLFERTINFSEPIEDGQRRRLLEIAARCPVHLLLERGADVATSVAEGQLAGPRSDGLHEKLLEKLCDEADVDGGG